MPDNTKSDIIIEICRSDNDKNLQILIGSTIEFWRIQGFSLVGVTYACQSAGMYGVFGRTNPAGAPTKIAGDANNAFTAVVVMTGQT